MENNQSKDYARYLTEPPTDQMNVKVPSSWKIRILQKGRKDNRNQADQMRMLLIKGFEAVYGEKLDGSLQGQESA